MSEHLRVNPVLCDAYGHCAELLPQLIKRDEWGYPIIESGPVPKHLRKDARRAVIQSPIVGRVARIGSWSLAVQAPARC